MVLVVIALAWQLGRQVQVNSSPELVCATESYQLCGSHFFSNVGLLQERL